MAAGVWAKLEALYMTKSPTKRAILKQKLYSYKMQPNRRLEDHLDEFNNIILNLENTDVKLEDDLAVILLNSLPQEKYEYFVDTILYRSEDLTLEDMVTALTSKEMKKQI